MSTGRKIFVTVALACIAAYLLTLALTDAAAACMLVVVLCWVGLMFTLRIIIPQILYWTITGLVRLLRRCFA